MKPNDPAYAGQKHYTPWFLNISDPLVLLGQLDAQYREGRTLRPGEYLHLFLLGVAAGFTGRTIGHHLVGTCLEV